MNTNYRYIVVHDFNKIGSVYMKFSDEDTEQSSRILLTCMNLAKSPIQVVLLGGPNALEVYSEYAPYKEITDEQELINMCLYRNVPGREEM